MHGSTFERTWRVGVFVASGALIFLGFMGFMIEVSKRWPSATNFYGYVLAAVFVACGAVICLAARRRYGGGLWSLFGLLFVATATARIAFVSESYMRDRHLLSPNVFFLTTVALWGVGCYCLIWGHLRYHSQQRRGHQSEVTL